MTEEELEKLNKEQFGLTLGEVCEDLGRLLVKCKSSRATIEKLQKQLEQKDEVINDLMACIDYNEYKNQPITGEELRGIINRHRRTR